jgi:hypothetical protein
MFTHDPFQAYQTLAAFGGGATPYGLPYQGIHPMAFATQPYANPGIAGFGPYAQHLQGLPQQGLGYPQHLQAYGQQLQGWNPFVAGLQNPIQHHQLGHQFLQNPLLAASLQNPLQNPLLQNPMINPLLAYQGWQQQQTPFGYPLAPQSLIGGPSIGQPYPQINPMAQFALRQGGFGPSPLGAY